MLQSIRDNTQGWIAGTIISLLILSFAMWGIHSYVGGGTNTTVAQVNGIEISKSQLSVAYERLRRQIQSQSGSIALSVNKEAELKNKALQTLISIQVLKQASIDQGYVITERQVDSLLESMPEFQVNGVFSLSRFQEVLSNTLFTAVDFLDLLKTSLLIDQPRLGIYFSSFALPNEIASSATLVKQQRQIMYGVIPVSSLVTTPIIISADKIQAYYTLHQDQYKTAEQVNIEYVELNLSDLMGAIHPTESELKNYYNENLNMFIDSKTKKALPYDQAKSKVKEILTRQLAEEKFANLREKLANTSYEHPESLQATASALNLPIKQSGMFIKEKGGNDISQHDKIRDAAFSNDVLNGQNNSDVIQVSDDDAVVLRVKLHVPAALLSLSAVQDKIINTLKSEEENKLAEKKAIELKRDLMSGKVTQEQLAEQYRFTWVNPGYIERHDTKVDSAILDTTFSLPKPVNDKTPMYGVTKLLNGYALVALTAVKEGSIGNKQDQVDAFTDQIQNAEGALEYDLYKDSLMKKAKIAVSAS